MIYLILALLLFTALNLVSAAASRNANTNLVSLLTGIGSMVIPFIVVLPSLAKQSFQNQKAGLIMALLTGLLVGLYALAVNKSFTQNKVAIIAPVVFGGAILLTSVMSYFIFKEKISQTEGIGLVLVLIGLAIIIYARAFAA